MSIKVELIERVRKLLLEGLPNRKPCEHQLQFWVDKQDVEITGEVVSVTGVFIEDVYVELPNEEEQVYLEIHVAEMHSVDGKIDEENFTKVSLPAGALDRAATMLYAFTEALELQLEPCDEPDEVTGNDHLTSFC